MLHLALAFSFTIAFPSAGAKLPYVEKAYMIGAVERGEVALAVQGREVEVYRTGAWASVVDVQSGTNTIECTARRRLADGTEQVYTTNHVFVVAGKPAPPPPGANAKPPPEKKWEKLDYCGDVPREHPSSRPASEVMIAIDPGHGGSDTGALSPHGLYEKNANLLQAKAVRDALVERGYRVLMTRESDCALVLQERPRAAVEQKADAFVSIHHNAPAANQDPRTARYTAVYAWNPIGEHLAGAISSRVAAALDGDIPSKGVLHANFAVTRNPEIPSCLVEVDFMTSPQGEEAIFNHARRRFIAAAIADGIDDWRRSIPPPAPAEK